MNPADVESLLEHYQPPPPPLALEKRIWERAQRAVILTSNGDRWTRIVLMAASVMFFLLVVVLGVVSNRSPVGPARPQDNTEKQEAIALQFQPQAGDTILISGRATGSRTVTVEFPAQKFEYEAAGKGLRRLVDGKAPPEWRDTHRIHLRSGMAIDGVLGKSTNADTVLLKISATSDVSIATSDIARDDKGILRIEEIPVPEESRTPERLAALLLPAKPVVIGASWTQEKNLPELLGGLGPVEGRLAVTLKETKLVDGFRCAVLTLSMEAAVFNSGKAKLHGEAVVRIDRGIVLSLTMEGPIELSGSTWDCAGAIRAELKEAR